MAIDPMMYRKYSGKSGDPYANFGAALAQNDAQTSRREQQRHANRSMRTSRSERFQAVLFGLGIVVLLFGGVILLWAIFG
ncbi:MAG: hypothetical protein KF838_09395 [Phycisphaeraceae bacterium]|nr:MAG: hypothetical protein KF838_09395 [Phycisphaeraceae bacterium]